MKNDEVRLQLTIDVHYELGRTDIRDLERVLIAAADHLAGNGMLSGETEASVLTWKSAVSTPNASVSISGGEPEYAPRTCSACSRCGSRLNRQGLCTDITCPFENHEQHCGKGWVGHREHSARDKEKCSCFLRPNTELQ